MSWKDRGQSKTPEDRQREIERMEKYIERLRRELDETIESMEKSGELTSPGTCQMCGGTLMWAEVGILSHVEDTNCDDPVIQTKEG